MTNETWTVYDTSGTALLGPDSLADLFSDPFASGDPSATMTRRRKRTSSPRSAPMRPSRSTPPARRDQRQWLFGLSHRYGTRRLLLPGLPASGLRRQCVLPHLNEFCGSRRTVPRRECVRASKSQLVNHASSVNPVSFPGPSWTATRSTPCSRRLATEQHRVPAGRRLLRREWQQHQREHAGLLAGDGRPEHHQWLGRRHDDGAGHRQ